MSTIIITSTGISEKKIQEAFLKNSNTKKDFKIAIITTAAEGKENNKYAKLAKTQFEELGFSDIVFFDIETQDTTQLSEFQILYVCGGNTFYLLYHMKKSGAGFIITELLKNTDVTYIGVSAGSIILGPTIGTATLVDPDPNDVDITDYNGLAILNFEIHPHFTIGDENEIAEYEKKENKKVVRLSNEQALIIKNGEKIFV